MADRAQLDGVIGAYYQHVSTTPRDRCRRDVLTPRKPASPQWRRQVVILNRECALIDLRAINPSEPLACICVHHYPSNMATIQPL
jgi:hypothetical protein